MLTTTLLLYHVLRPLPDPAALCLWQAEVARRLELTGRLVVSPQGLQGILGGTARQLGEYASTTHQHPALGDLRFGWSEGRGQGSSDLDVTVQQDVSGFGPLAERHVAKDARGVGRHLTPREVHELVADRGSEVVFFDVRDRRSCEAGRFRGAVVPDVDEARGVLADFRSGRFDGLKDRPVVTYCTDGVRSEILTSLMVQRGFSQVYVLDGGIVSYGSVFAERGLWEGALYVLGERVQIVFGESPALVGHCEDCGARTYSYRQCVAPLCHAHALLCNGCADFALCAAHRN